MAARTRRRDGFPVCPMSEQGKRQADEHSGISGKPKQERVREEMQQDELAMVELSLAAMASRRGGGSVRWRSWWIEVVQVGQQGSRGVGRVGDMRNWMEVKQGRRNVPARGALLAVEQREEWWRRWPVWHKTAGRSCEARQQLVEHATVKQVRVARADGGACGRRQATAGEATVHLLTAQLLHPFSPVFKQKLAELQESNLFIYMRSSTLIKGPTSNDQR